MQNTIRQAIVTDGDVLRIFDDGEVRVASIEKAHRALCTAQKVLTDFDINGIKTAQGKLKEIEGEIAFEVAHSPDFKNEGQRKAAVAKELASSEQYKLAQNNVKELEATRSDLDQKVMLAKIDLERARNMFAVWLRQADIVSGLSREQIAVTIEPTITVQTSIGGQNNGN